MHHRVKLLLSTDVYDSRWAPLRRCEYGNLYIPGQAVTAKQLEDALVQLVAMAHAHHVKIIFGTLPPIKGGSDYTDSGEVTRNAYNNWIRSQTIADGVIDFDTILRDPNNLAYLLPAYDAGDHTHPNNAGNQAMANGINLSLFR